MEKQSEITYLPPVFERPPEIENIREGDDVVLKCNIRANPPPTIKWVRHGYMLSHSNKYQIYNNTQDGIYSLTIRNFKVGDDGEYVCIANNIAGESSIIAVIKKGNKDVTSKEFGSFKELHDYQLKRLTSQIEMMPSFDCEQFENSLLNNQEFRKNQTDSFNESPYSFNQGIKLDDKPESAPEIVQKPKDIFCYEGDDLTFKVKVTGNPVPKIYWFKNGKALFPSEKCGITFDRNVACLNIEKLLAEDAASYTLLAENEFGSATFTINLRVHYIYEDIITVPKKEPTQIQPMPEPEPETIILKAVTRNITRTVREDDLPKISGIRPNFYLIPYDMEALENQIVRFELRVSGRPEPEITWYKDGKRLFDCEHFKLVVNEEGSHALLIMGADVQDSGTYKCIASNLNGEATFTVKLIVHEKEPTISPKFVERFQNTNIKAGESIALHCRAVGAPPPILTWQKDGMQIHPNPPHIEIVTDEASSSLFLNNITTSDAGWYQCTAQNQDGSVTTRARLNVEPIFQAQQVEPLKLNLPKTHRKIEPEPEQQPEVVHLKHVQRYYEEIQTEQTDFIQYEELKTKPIFATHLRDVSLQRGNTGHFEA